MTPAAATAAWSPPKWRTASSTAARMASGLRTSPTTPRTAAPCRATTSSRCALVAKRYSSAGSSAAASTATTFQPAATSASTVAAPMPRAAPVTTATGLTSRTSASRPTSPGRRPGRRGGRSLLGARSRGVAQHAVGRYRPHPLGAQTWQQPAMGSVQPGSARSRRTAAASRASISDVSVRPACASPPGTTARHTNTSSPSAAQRRATSASVASLPPCAFTQHDAAEGGACAADELDEERGQGLVPDEQRAGERGVLAAGPVGDRRAPRRRRAGVSASPGRGPRRSGCRYRAGGAARAVRANRAGSASRASPAVASTCRQVARPVTRPGRRSGVQRGRAVDRFRCGRPNATAPVSAPGPACRPAPPSSGR